MNNFVEQLDLLQRGAEEILIKDELVELLKKEKPLRIKAGFDPTAPDIHLGHTVLLTKLRQFQDLGHHILFLIGDFTAMIGDPTGRNVTRKPLSREEIIQNANTYQEQAFKILDRQKTEVRFNSEWLDKLGSKGLIELSAKYTVARMLEREDFKTRYQAGHSISIHEFLYPLIQGYDSVELKADIEIGGTDQKFNLLVGRELQKDYGQKPQVVMTFPLLEGLDGVNKMSKSLNNYIGIQEPPKEIFGKLMSISDELMWRYYDLLSFKSTADIEKLKHSVKTGANPRDIKIELAKELVARFHNASAAEEAHVGFVSQFQKHMKPENIEAKTVDIEKTLSDFISNSVSSIELPNLLEKMGKVPSTSKARQLIKGGAVSIDDRRVEDEKQEVIADGKKRIYRLGKREFVHLSVWSDFLTTNEVDFSVRNIEALRNVEWAKALLQDPKVNDASSKVVLDPEENGYTLFLKTVEELPGDIEECQMLSIPTLIKNKNGEMCIYGLDAEKRKHLTLIEKNQSLNIDFKENSIFIGFKTEEYFELNKGHLYLGLSEMVTIKSAFFEVRLANVINKAGLQAEYEFKTGIGNSSVDFKVIGKKTGKTFLIELTSLRDSVRLKKETIHLDVYDNAGTIDDCSVIMSTTGISDKNSLRLTEIHRLQNVICTKVYDAKNGKPIKFPEPSAHSLHIIIVDTRGFAFKSDIIDHCMVTLGSEILKDEYKPEKPVIGIFDLNHPKEEMKYVRERIHAIGFIREDWYDEGEIIAKTQFVINPKFNLDDNVKKLFITKRIFEAW